MNEISIKQVSYIMRLSLSMFIGSIVGALTSLIIVTIFAAIILNPIFNVYYASVFLIVGSYYSFNIFKKSQIQLQLDSNEY